ncbi:MAG: hypothetical protein ABI857_08220 [Acidobacteriota bacterium]
MVKSRKNANSGYWAYANNFTYNAAGAVATMQLGNGTTPSSADADASPPKTGGEPSTPFNSRLQPTHIALGSVQNGTDKLRLDYQYGDLDWNGTVISGTNNGNVAKQTITVASVGTTPDSPQFRTTITIRSTGFRSQVRR